MSDARLGSVPGTRTRAYIPTLAQSHWQVCIHEAGHAVAATLSGIEVHDARVWQVPGSDGHSGKVRWRRVDVTGKKQMRVSLAGPAAEVLIFGRHMISQADTWADMENARLAAEQLGKQWDERTFVLHTVTFLRPHRRAIEAVARALQARGELSGDQVRRIIRDSKG
jgi:hypothetical protein